MRQRRRGDERVPRVAEHDDDHDGDEGQGAERRKVVANRVRVHARRERSCDGGDERRDAEDNHPDHVDVDAVGVERDRGVAQGTQQLAEPGLGQHGDRDRDNDDERQHDEVHALVAAELEASDGQVRACRCQAVGARAEHPAHRVHHLLEEDPEAEGGQREEDTRQPDGGNGDERADGNGDKRREQQRDQPRDARAREVRHRRCADGGEAVLAQGDLA